MEWREQTSVSCMDAFDETKRWIEEVTGKQFGSSNFRAALENGVLLCDLMNKLKPGIIKRLNRHSTPIAGLDNVNVFLKACSKLGLNESMLFHPGDLQDLSMRVTLRREESNRRLKNVLITLYWLGRQAQLEPCYCGPQLNFKSFEGLLGLALSKALEEGSGLCPRDGVYGEQEKENLYHVRPAYHRDNSVDSLAYPDHRTGHQGSEGCGSDVEADQMFRMSAQTDPTQTQERGYVPPKEGAYPAAGDKTYIPSALLRRKRGHGQGSLTRVSQIQLRPGRPPVVNPGWIWSKSTSDLPMESQDYEEGVDNSGAPDETGPSHPSNGARPKETEFKWQEDLSKWKNKRRSTNSDLQKKFQERRHEVTETTNGTRATVEHKIIQNGDQLSPCVPGPTSTSSHPSRVSHAAVRPHSVAVLSRSRTVESLLRHPGPGTGPSSCSPLHNQVSLSGAMPASHRPLLGEEVPAASPTADSASSSSAATTPSACSLYTSQTHVELQPGPAPLPPAAGPTQKEGRRRRSMMGPLPYRGVCTVDRTPNSPQGTGHKVTSLHHGPFLQSRDVAQQKHCSLKPAGTGAWQEEGGLGNGPTYHSSLYRYNNCMTLAASASLPRGYRRSEGSARLSTVHMAQPFGTRPSRVSPLPRLSPGSDCKTHAVNGDQRQPLQPALSRQVATSLIRAPLRDPPSPATPSDTHLPPPPNRNTPQRHMRVSLRLKPNSVDDFGFQTEWSATGASVTFVQQGSPAELCQLCVGDVITTLGGAKVEQMSSSQWESDMTSALQSGTLTMDVSRYSNQGCTERPAHKHIVAIPTRPDLPAQTSSTQGLGIQTRNREIEEAPKSASSKELEQIVLTNQMRRAEFFNVKGGTESAISDLQVPSLIQSNWSWDHEQERKRQERWQEEQERHLQERYQRDQQRLQNEWQRAQERAGQEPRGTEEKSVWLANPGVARPASPTAHAVTGPAPQREDETASATHQNTGAGFAAVQDPEPALVKPQSADPAAVGPLGTETGSTPPSLVKEDDDRAWPDVPTGGFTQLSSAYRAKSKSTPMLASLHMQTKAGPGEQSKEKPASKEEQDRRLILEEMKKRTQLLTDNSWIRKPSASSLKDPLCTGVPLRRYESLDSLHTPSFPEPAGFPRPLSAAGFSGPGRSISPRYTTCSAVPDQLTSAQLLTHDVPLRPGQIGRKAIRSQESEL